MIDDDIYPSTLFKKRYKSKFFGIYFYDIGNVNYVAKCISIIYKYLYIIAFSLNHHILKRSYLPDFMKRLYKAHYYGFIIDNKFDQKWVDIQCKKYAISPSNRIILCFSGILNSKKKEVVIRGYWWIEQPVFVLFILGFSLSFIGIIGVSLGHIINDSIGTKTVYIILFCCTYAIMLSFLFCMLKAHLWDSHQLLKRLKFSNK